MNAEHPYLRLYGMLLSQLLFFALLFSSMLLKERSLLPWCIMALILHGLLLCGLFGCFHRYRARKTGASGAGNVSRKTICAAMKPQRPAWRRSARRSRSRSTASPPSAN